ncbi:sensor histidine kinase [Mucilaginibacter flavus]|uniref:sensor histidine kinase n=1 Tax=Mucilaginibacter flavus TaxID=931504 RepID=UPI0025B37A8F|nr:histidine kinase [Mucilaginibacter flavus]MDN3584591.1 histidine kinase [Mucilaginibacter flavus]
MQKHRLNDKWARIIGVPLIGILLILLAHDSWASYSWDVWIVKFVKNTLFILFYWESNRVIFVFLRKKFPRPKDAGKKILFQVLIFAVFITVMGLIVAVINQSLKPPENHETFLDELKDTMQKSTILLFIITVCYEVAYFFGNWEHSLYESERLEKESLISQFELLKNQISPHFLFNSLNALITLVPEDPQLSVLFIQKLSNVYRHILTYNEKNIVELKAELDFLKDYIFLFQMRFGENLIIDYRLTEVIDHIMIVPFTMQMLVENAIKHNIISNRKPLTITVIQENEHIIIRNNLQKKTSGVESTHTGLNNIINRYKLLTEKKVDIVITDIDFSVSIPLILENTAL